MKQEPFVLERSFPVPASQLWEAITDKNKMKEWYFDLAEFKPQVGFEFEFFGGDEEKKYLHYCKVTEVEPGKKLAYTWRYKDYPGESTVSFELFPEGNTTRLKLTHSGLETFTTENPDFGRESFVAGWTHIIGTSLTGYISKKPSA